MIDAFIARLLVTAKNQNREVDSQPDQDRAESDRHHVEFMKNEEAGRERHQTAKQQGQAHPDERHPATEANVENAADENDGADQRDDDVVPHAEGNLCDISGAARHQDFERPAFPALVGGRLERFHFVHQFLAIDGADARLVRDGEKDPHRAIGRGERLVFFDGRVAGERLQRRRDDSERIQPQLDLRPGRTRFQLGMQTMQPLPNFLRLKEAERLVENRGLEIEQQRKRNRL